MPTGNSKLKNAEMLFFWTFNS